MKFCSLDLEGTGLDPTKDAITEVGAVLFEVDPQGKVKFGEEFSQLVKPNIPIPQFIQELTGINEETVAKAPAWEEVMPKLKEFVGDRIIVGQNIKFDLDFLSAHGLNFSQGFIDTKELAYLFAPRARFFNLEYLLRYFGKPLQTHHRALDDSKSAAVLLEQILLAFNRLPVKVQKQISQLLQGSNLLYKDLFFVRHQQKKETETQEGHRQTSSQPSAGGQGSLFSAVKPAETANFAKLFKKDGTFLALFTAEGLSGENVRKILDRPQGAGASVVMSLPDWQGLDTELNGWEVIGVEKNYFCEYRFQALRSLPNPSDALVKFLVKILVWQNSGDSLDFSKLAFSGEELLFRDFVRGDFEICSGHAKEKTKLCQLSNVLRRVSTKSRIVTTHSAWLSFVKKRPGQEYARGIFWDNLALEDALVWNVTQSLNLKIARGKLIFLYDPETKQGVVSEKFASCREEIERVLNALDLSFGLLGISLAAEGGVVDQRVVDSELRASMEFEKAAAAFKKLLEYYRELIESLRSTILKTKELELIPIADQLEADRKLLEEFIFHPQPEKIYWVDLFNGSLRLKIRELTLGADRLGRFRALGFTGMFSHPIVRDHFQNLLKLPSSTEEIDFCFHKPRLEVFLPQGLPSPNQENSQVVARELLEQWLSQSEGRSLVLFNSQKALENFYQGLDKHKVGMPVLAQRLTGHQWKNIEEYAASDRIVWLLSAQNFFRNIKELPPTSQIFIMRLPYEVPGVLAAVLEQELVFQDFVLPKTIMRFEQLFVRFINSGETSKNKKLVFFDQRICEDYNQPLLDSIRSRFEANFENFGPSSLGQSS